MPIRSQTDWTWFRRWLDRRIAMPRSSVSRRRRSRISTTPSGSIEVVGSSRMSRSGDLTSASAMPEPLAHAARVVLDRVVGPIGEADLLEDLVDGGLRLGLAQAVELGRVAEVLAARSSPRRTRPRRAGSRPGA